MKTWGPGRGASPPFFTKGWRNHPVLIVSRRFVVSGRVQGVGFRYFVADIAAHERLGGWVTILRDGRVEVLIEGEAQAVDRFEGKLRSGPPAARVDNVEVEEREPSGRATAFRVEPSA